LFFWGGARLLKVGTQLVCDILEPFSPFGKVFIRSDSGVCFFPEDSTCPEPQRNEIATASASIELLKKCLPIASQRFSQCDEHLNRRPALSGFDALVIPGANSGAFGDVLLSRAFQRAKPDDIAAEFLKMLIGKTAHVGVAVSRGCRKPPRSVRALFLSFPLAKRRSRP
jgi:hypothetical protein